MKVRISLLQYILVIVTAQIGAGVLTLPRDLIERTGSTDGWISIILGGLLAIMVSHIIVRIMEKHPDDDLYALLPKLFGKWVGTSLNVLWILYAAVCCSIVMFTTLHLINVWIFPKTPQYHLMLLFVIPIYMVTKLGFKGIARFAEMVYFTMIWMPFILLFALTDIDWHHLRPVGREGWWPIITAIRSTIQPLNGFELAFFMYPYLTNKSKAYVGITVANLISTSLYLMVTLICYLRFTPFEIKQYVWPALNLLKLIRFPFVERLEIIFLPFYLFVMFKTIIPYLFLTAEGTRRLFRSHTHVNYLRIYIGLWIISSFFFVPTFNQVIQMGKILGSLGLYLNFLFPPLLLVYLWIFERRRKEEKA